MKQKLIDALTTKFGVGAKVVEGIAEKLSKTISTEEEVATAVEGVTFQQVLESYSDKRANEASETARKNAIKQYETTHKLKDGKPIEEPNPPTPPTPPAPPTPPVPPKKDEKKGEDDVPQYIKDMQATNASLLETIKALQSEVSGMKTKKLTEDRQSTLNKVIGKLTSAQQNPYKRITLDTMSEEDFNTFIEETKKDVESIEKENAANAASANRPFSGATIINNQKASKEELDAVVSKIS